MADFDEMLEARRVDLAGEIGRGEALRLSLEQRANELLAAPGVAKAEAERSEAAAAQASIDAANLGSVPARRVAGWSHAYTFTGQRRRVFGYINDAPDGADMALGSKRLRLRTRNGTGGLDIFNDGSIKMPGETRRPSFDPTLITLRVDKRRRLISRQTTAGYRMGGLYVGFDKSVTAGGLIAAPNGEVSTLGGGLFSWPNGKVRVGGEMRRSTTQADVVRKTIGKRGRVLESLTADRASLHNFTILRRADGRSDMLFGGKLVARLTSAGDLQVTGGSTAGVQTTDVYVRGTEVLPVMADTTRIAGWGSSTMQGMAGRLATMSAGFGATYYPGGVGGENLYQILARLGSRPAQIVLPGNELPASGSVVVTISNGISNRAGTSFVGTLLGVPVTVASDGTAWTLTRTTPGAVVAVPAGTPLISAPGETYKDAVALLNLGKNSFGAGGMTAQIIADATHAAFDWLAPQVKRALVIGHFTDSNTAVGGGEYNDIRAVNAALKTRYKLPRINLFVDLQAFICENVPFFGQTAWQVAALTPTADDLASMAEGRKPPSLSSDAGHLNSPGYAAATWLIQQHLTATKWLNQGI